LNRALAAESTPDFVAIVAPHIEDLAARKRYRSDAGDDYKGQHHGVFNGRRTVFTAKKSKNSCHGTVSDIG